VRGGRVAANAAHMVVRAKKRAQGTPLGFKVLVTVSRRRFSEEFEAQVTPCTTGAGRTLSWRATLGTSTRVKARVCDGEQLPIQVTLRLQKGEWVLAQRGWTPPDEMQLKFG
jgi:hypothetical protein